MGPQEQKIERRLAAIFAADAAGYSRLMTQDEVGTLRTLTARRNIMDRLFPASHGRLLAQCAPCPNDTLVETVFIAAIERPVMGWVP